MRQVVCALLEWLRQDLLQYRLFPFLFLHVRAYQAFTAGIPDIPTILQRPS
jgi:hypothetical protein